MPGGSRWSRTFGPSATCSTRPASTCAAMRPTRFAWSSSRSTTPMASAISTRSVPTAAVEGRFAAGMAKDFYVSPFIEMDGRYVVHVRDDLRPPVDRDQRAGRRGAAAHDEPGPSAPPADRPNAPADAPSPSAHDPSDDRADPLARAAALAAGSAGSIVTAARPRSTRSDVRRARFPSRSGPPGERGEQLDAPGQRPCVRRADGSRAGRTAGRGRPPASGRPAP